MRSVAFPMSTTNAGQQCEASLFQLLKIDHPARHHKSPEGRPGHAGGSSHRPRRTTSASSPAQASTPRRSFRRRSSPRTRSASRRTSELSATGMTRSRLRSTPWRTS
eukprot:124570-Hanusia_phi.AAC.1